MLFRRFPYGVIYEVQDFEVVILACLRCERDPNLLHDRVLPREDL
jgi:hypothetical protein